MAYTKYSLTPANNTATPPDGAPEGMLPSAVNDTMRDMMAQIRDCGDGIRDGTYTMTAPKITGGTITGSTINNSAIGGTTAAAGKFTTLEATGVTTVQAGTVSAPAITTSGDTNTGIFFPAADTIAFAEGGAEAMRIDSSGNVGIGITSPGSLGLSVAKSSGTATGLQLYQTTTEVFRLTTNNTTVDVRGRTALPLVFFTDDTERMRIDSSGNVGIGTSSPGAKLQVAGGDILVSTVGNKVNFATTSSSTVNYVGGAADGFSLELACQRGASQPFVYKLDYANGHIWSTAGSERMRITDGGSLLLGTTTEQAPITAVFSSSGAVLSLDRTSNIDGTLRDMVQFRRSVTSVGSITCSNTATAYNTSSDYRLKENIAPMVGALDKVSQLKPCTYKWKIDGSHGEGFIAHELAEVLPNAVSGEKDAVDAEGNPQYQGVDTSFLVATLTAAIQEQQAMIEELKQEVAALKAK